MCRVKKNISLSFLLLLSSCTLKDTNSQAELWTKRMCCDKANSLFIKELNVAPHDNIEISFCEEADSDMRLKLLEVGNNQQKTLIDLIGRLPLEDQKLSLRINERPKDAKGIFNFNEDLNDGSYYLFISTNHSCGDIRFNLSGGKKTQEKLLCIKYCEDR